MRFLAQNGGNEGGKNMFYNIKIGCVGGNGGDEYTLLYYMRARKDGVDGIDGANGLMGGRDVFSQVGEKVFLDGEEKFLW